jgi:hypothetical protein
MKSKLPLIVSFIAVFIFSVAIQTAMLNLNPSRVVYAAVDDAKTAACKNTVFQDECKTGFDDGYAKGKAGETDQQKVCGAPIQAPDTTGIDEQKGCYEGVNYANSEKGNKPPGASDVKTVDPKASDDAQKACKDKSGKEQKACEAGFDGAKCDDIYKDKELAACKDAAGQATSSKDTVDCDTKLSSVLSWIACPLIDMGVSFTDFVFKDFVRPMLENVPISTDPSDGSYKAWQQFRLIANVLLVGSLLAIVYSQAKGGK